MKLAAFVFALVSNYAAVAAEPPKTEIEFPDKDAEFNMYCDAGKASFLAKPKDAERCSKLGGTLIQRKNPKDAKSGKVPPTNDPKFYPAAPSNSFDEHARRFDSGGTPQIMRNYDPSQPVGQ